MVIEGTNSFRSVQGGVSPHQELGADNWAMMARTPLLHRRRPWLLCLALVAVLAPRQQAAAQADSTSPVDDTLFQVFVDQAATCADHPVPSLLYQGKSSKVESRLGSLHVEAKWLSARPRSIDDITVCTNSDFDRLYMLEGQCASWGGPVSAVIYLPLELFRRDNGRLVDEAKRQLATLHAGIEASGNCTLDMVLVTEMLHADAMWSFPYNSLRNQAIARTRTKLLILLDVDFLLSDNLRQQLLEPTRYAALLSDTYINLDVIVLPSFETKPGLPLAEGAAIARRAISGTKKQVFKLFRKGSLVQFAPFFNRGHGPTEHKRWFGVRRQYPVVYEPGFEPFVLMSRVHVPWYDERFRGYGWDKITHIFQLAWSGYNLMVHPTGFLVHRPHRPSAGYNQTFTGPAYTENHKPTDELKKLDKVAREMMKDVKKGYYPLFGVTALAGCRPLSIFNPKPGAEVQQQQQQQQQQLTPQQMQLQEQQQELAPRVRQEPQTVKQQMQQPLGGGWW